MNIAFGLLGSSFTPRFLTQWNDTLSKLYNDGYSVELVICDDIDELYKKLKSMEKLDKSIILTNDVQFHVDNIVDLINSPHDIVTSLFLDNSFKKYAVEYHDDLVKLDPETVNKIIDLQYDETTKKYTCNNSRYIKVKSCKGNLLCISKISIDSYDSLSDVLKNYEIYADGLCRVGMVRSIIQ